MSGFSDRETMVNYREVVKTLGLFSPSSVPLSSVLSFPEVVETLVERDGDITYENPINLE